jgi:hypothetical protein
LALRLAAYFLAKRLVVLPTLGLAVDTAIEHVFASAASLLRSHQRAATAAAMALLHMPLYSSAEGLHATLVSIGTERGIGGGAQPAVASGRGGRQNRNRMHADADCGEIYVLCLDRSQVGCVEGSHRYYVAGLLAR